MNVSVKCRAGARVVHLGHVKGDDEGSGGGDEREGSFEKKCVGISYPCTCACQKATQLSIFATLQRRRTATSLLLITSLALETARGVGSRGQLERSGGLARVAGTALHASGECLVRRTFNLCNKRHTVHRQHEVKQATRPRDVW